MNDRDQPLDLVRRYLDGTATIDEVRSLEALLLGDPALRHTFLRYTHVDAALAGTRRSRALSAADYEPLPARRAAWLQWRPLTAAAAGLVLGMFCTSVVFAYAAPRFAPVRQAARRLWSESFESGPSQTRPGLPLEPGVWYGDTARVITEENGVKPKAGTQMLRFVSATFPGENAGKSAWGDVYRLTDLRGQVSEGRAIVRLSAHFDGAGFPVSEVYSCFVELCALEDDPSNAPQPLVLSWVRENSASVTGRKFPMKGDGVWQEAVVEVPVSSQTRFVLAHMAVLRRKPSPTAEPAQFSGHYLDDVKLELLARPTAPDL